MNDKKYRREVDSVLGTGQILFDQVKSWLACCGLAGDHEARGIFEPRITHNLLSETEKLVERNMDPQHMLLIDVVDEKLVAGRLDVDFVAMSYVWGGWGGAEVEQTTKESLQRFCLTRGLTGLGDKIPCVVRDAMTFVRSIGLRYLWCDLLCVVSDDPDVRNSQIEMMDAVYSEASMTIINLTGSHGNMPLPGIRPGSRHPICLSETLGDGVRFVTRHVPLTGFYDQTVHTTRGWTFQEELLSRRCLYVTDRQMYFKCSLAHHREDEFLFSLNEDAKVETCLNSFPTGYSSLTNVGQSFSVYCDLLSGYTRRQLTYDHDILKAFEGFASVLAREYQSEFREGLPTKFLFDALLWIPRDRSRRRFGIDHSETQICSPPTWSWAAWDGGCITQVLTSIQYFNRTGQQVYRRLAKPTMEGFLYGQIRCGTFRISDICTLAFVARVQQILSSISHAVTTEFDSFMRQLTNSGLNCGGWSTEPPTDEQAYFAFQWSSKSFPSYAQDYLDPSPQAPPGLCEMLQQEQFNYRAFLHSDNSGKWWPFDYMTNLLPDDRNNWWPPGLAVPNREQISSVLRHARLSEALEHLDLAELPGVLKDFESPCEMSPPLCFFAIKIDFSNFEYVSPSMTFKLSSHFSIEGGQLLQQDKGTGTDSSTFTTRNGRYDCSGLATSVMDFSERKDPLYAHSTFSEKPATAFFLHGKPCGVLFDFEDDIVARVWSSASQTPNEIIWTPSDLIEISRTESLSNVMLIKRRPEDGYTRVAVGQMYTRVFMGQGVETSWIRLY
ncbi:hypothetical protein HDK77DRAFT_442758 [Phyllosticta capitalensis]